MDEDYEVVALAEKLEKLLGEMYHVEKFIAEGAIIIHPEFLFGGEAVKTVISVLDVNARYYFGVRSGKAVMVIY